MVARCWSWRLLVCTLGGAAVDSEPRGHAHPLAAFPLALCLDGSPGLYYFRQGHGSGTAKFHIYFEGGGFCTDDADCAERAGSYFGTTKQDPPTIKLDHPFFSASYLDNPLMWNWNHVKVRYCDGAYFSGDVTRPVESGGNQPYYRGRHITFAVLKDLASRYALGRATDVVFSGCSAGGIHVFAHIDALREALPSRTRVVGLADSGFYLDKEMFTPLKRFVVTGQNATGMLHKRCVSDNPGKEERCLVGAVASPYLGTPVFAWQSRYDSDQRTCEMSRSCASSEHCVRSYGNELVEEMKSKLLANASMGAFVDSCSRHCQTKGAPRDDTTGETPLRAFAAWYRGKGKSLYGQLSATEEFPCIRCCEAEGLQTLFML